MKKTSKKLAGVIMIATMLAVIGVAVVSAQNEDGMFWDGRNFMAQLTDEQREDLQAMMQQKMEEYGVEMPTQDELLKKQIQQTEQRLERLNRQRELREEGYEWEDIQEIIQEEFGLEFPEAGQCMQFGHGFRHGASCGPFGPMADKNSES